jgi:hypothetical protein
MRNLILGLLITALLLAAAAPGCSKGAGASDADATRPGPVTVAVDEAAAKTAEAVEVIGDYVASHNDQFVADMRRGLSEIQREARDLDAKVEQSTGETKAAAKAALVAVRSKLALIEAHLQQAESAPESAFDDAKKGLKASYDDLKDSVAVMRRQLSEAVAP